jgi:hypothetical protein
MPEYLVTVPIAGYIVKMIEAQSEKEAIDKAIKEESPFGEIKMQNGWGLENIDVYRHIFQGNISHIDVSEATAELEEE